MGDDKKGQCPVCLEEFKFLKLLQCGHAFCVNCIENQLFSPRGSNQGTYAIKCPLDRKCSTLPDGKVENLKSKFFVDLPCANCYENKSINESWWCDVCQLTVCSTCAMKKHKDHVCHEWNDFDVVKECYGLYNSRAQDVRKWRNSVHEYCIGLEERLIKLVVNDGDDSVENALVSIENTFGRVEQISFPEGRTVDKLEQKLSTVSNIMQKVSGSSTLPAISNVVKTKHQPTLPSTEEVFEFCCKSNVSAPLGTVTGIKYLGSIDFGFQIKGPCAICSVSEDSVAVFDKFGIRILNVVSNQHTKFYEWSWQQHLQFNFNSDPVLRSTDNTLLFTATDCEHENRDCLIFCRVENLPCSINKRRSISTSTFPYSFTAKKDCQKLVGVISSKCTLVACSDGSKSELWIVEGERVKWRKSWVGKLQKFFDLKIVGGDTLLISGLTEVYKYSTKLDSVYDITYSGQVCAVSGPLFQLNDNCYAIDNARRKLIHIYSKQNVLKDLEITGNETFLHTLVRVNDQLLCSVIRTSSSLLYSLGKFKVY